MKSLWILTILLVWFFESNVSIPSDQNMSQEAKCFSTPILYTTYIWCKFENMVQVWTLPVNLFNWIIQGSLCFSVPILYSTYIWCKLKTWSKYEVSTESYMNCFIVTQKQAVNPLWMLHRAVWITASKYYAVCYTDTDKIRSPS